MVIIESQEQLEIFAWDVKHNMPYLPENLRLLIIMDAEAFDALVARTGFKDSDRFIYNSQAGVEFGIKKA
jgi:hypothetical protein